MPRTRPVVPSAACRGASHPERSNRRVATREQTERAGTGAKAGSGATAGSASDGWRPVLQALPVGARPGGQNEEQPVASTSGRIPDTAHDRYSYDIEMDDDSVENKDDVIILITATLIGLSTGLGVVLLNHLIHLIQHHLIWRHADIAWSQIAAHAGPQHWPFLLLPPLAAGAAVSALRALAGGFDGDPRALALGNRPHSVIGPPATRNGAKPAPARPAAGFSLSPADVPYPSPPPRPAAKRARRASRASLRLAAARVRLRPYLKTVAAAVTLGSGASLGPEGPSADLGTANAEKLRHLVPPRVRLP